MEDKQQKDAQAYRKILSNWATPFRKTEEEAWNDLSQKLPTTPTAAGNPFARNRKAIFWAMAASMALLLAIALWPREVIREIQVAEITEIELPDHSVMTLNAGSSARYNENWKSERSIELDGQAFFKVRKGEKFTVKTKSGAVEVLGTSFDVLAREGRFAVLCYSGKVKVTAGNEQAELAAAQSAEWKENRLVQSEFDSQRPDWRQGEFYFVDRPLREVLEELGRQFGVKVSADGIEGRLFTGRFTNEDLNRALETVCLPMGMKYSLQNDEVRISPE